MNHDLTKIVIRNNKIVKYKTGIVTPKLPSDCVSILGHTYKTVTISGQTWLASNLDIETESSIVNPSFPEFGRYYNIDDALELVEKIPGWHIPTEQEWKILINNVDKEINALRSKKYWQVQNGTDEYGMNIYPTGKFVDNEFSHVNEWGYYLTSTEEETNNYVCIMFQEYNRSNSAVTFKFNKYYTLRLIKD